MGLLKFIRSKNINQGIEEFKSVQGAVLLDVRTKQEYIEGHIPGSRNIPLQRIVNIDSTIIDKDTPLYVYCYSGSRSNQAADLLKKLGYTNVTNIGGIASYSGKIER